MPDSWKRQIKTFLLLCVVLLGAAASGQLVSGARNGSSRTENHLVGAWKRVSLEEPGADGQLRKADCAGQFVFSSDGRASVQVMYRGTQTGSAYAQGNYEASYGSYHVDDSSTFTFHIEGAVVRTLVGKDLKRAYEISGKRLTVKSTNPDEHWKVVWERY